MNIIIVGNVLQDVYLNIDTRTENLETDSHGTKWLDLSFDASQHSFFSRASSLGGAAITMEVLQKIGLTATVANSNLRYDDEGITSSSPTDSHRYILVSEGKVCYFAPSEFKKTVFTPPSESFDYLYIDRSANLDTESIKKINAYLDISSKTKLVVYVHPQNEQALTPLLKRAALIFTEQEPTNPLLSPSKTIQISENRIVFSNISEKISPNRIDVLTHLSFYSIVSATILGSFIIGNSVEESLKLARANAENSKLDSTLSYSDLKEAANNLEPDPSLELIAANLLMPPKGILAADESGGSIKKKFATLDIPDTYDNRRDYRNMLFTTPDLGKYVNGVILFDETARQTVNNNQTAIEYLTSHYIIPGIKVDEGLAKIGDSNETYTKGLEHLDERLEEYYNLGLRFAKWRAAFEITLSDTGDILTPTNTAIEKNCQILAEYAKKCQNNGLVPIVEPEVVYDGNYSIEDNSTITSNILDCLFNNLEKQNVKLKSCILKVNMILAGKKFQKPSTPQEIGNKTAEVLKSHVPEDLAGIVFLSGGQTPEQATKNLAEVIKNGPFPWPVTFSFARALQDPALYAWAGDNSNIEQAHQALLDRLIANSQALMNKD